MPFCAQSKIAKEMEFVEASLKILFHAETAPMVVVRSFL